MKITYRGPFDAVLVPDLGTSVVKGEPVEVPGALAASLLEQPDNWQAAEASLPFDQPPADDADDLKEVTDVD